MKKTIRFFLLISICSLFFAFSAKSQTVLTGPNQLCFGECATYEVVSLNGGSVLVNSWMVNGVNISTNTNSSITLCADQDVGMAIEASGVVSFANGFSYFVLDLTVEVSFSIDPIIVSTTATCPDSLAACDKICAFNSATYEVTNVPAWVGCELASTGRSKFYP